MGISQDEERALVPDTCNCGRGKLHRGFTKHIVKVGNEVVVIKDIPAWLCDLCDEAYITPDVSENIDEIMRAFRAGKLMAKPLAAGEVELKMNA